MARIVDEVRPRYVLVENSPMLTSRGLGVVLGDLAAMGFDARWGVLGADDAGAPHIRKRIWIVANAEGQRHEGCGYGEVREQVRSAPFGDNLPTAVRKRFATPTATANQLCPSMQKWPGCRSIEDGGSLNPTWVGLLMGWPRYWTATDRESSLSFTGWGPGWENGTPRVAKDVPARVDRLRCIGNGQVPQCVHLAWRTLCG